MASQRGKQVNPMVAIIAIVVVVVIAVAVYVVSFRPKKVGNPKTMKAFFSARRARMGAAGQAPGQRMPGRGMPQGPGGARGEPAPAGGR